MQAGVVGIFRRESLESFVDLEKACDRVPREVVTWALRKLDVDEWLIRSVIALYCNQYCIHACGIRS